MVRTNIKCAWCTLSNKQKGRRHFPYLLDIWNTGGVLVLHWCVWLIDPSLTSCFSSISSIFNHFCLCSKYAHYTNHFLSKTTNYKAIFVKMLISNFSRKRMAFSSNCNVFANSSFTADNQHWLKTLARIRCCLRNL